MKSLVRSELLIASVGSTHATSAAVDNPASLTTRPESTYESGKVVQTNGVASQPLCCVQHGVSEDQVGCKNYLWISYPYTWNALNPGHDTVATWVHSALNKAIRMADQSASVAHGVAESLVE